MNLSFDFDGTLSKKEVQQFANYCSKHKFILWIVTSRYKNGSYNDDLINISVQLNIPFERIIFTNGGLKKDYFKHYPDFIFHLDDNSYVVEQINKYTEVKGILVYDDWQQECWNAMIEYL